MQSVPLVVEYDADDPGCATLVVDALVAGRETRFVLDTGAPRSQVVVSNLTAGLSVIGTEVAHGLFEQDIVELVTLTELRFGPIRRAGIIVRRRQDTPRFQAANLLGLDVLAHPASFPTDSQLQRGTHGHCFTTARWSRATANACLDTGADITLIDTEFFWNNRALFGTAGTSKGTDTTGASSDAITCLVDRYTIGSVTFASHIVAVTDLPKTPDRIDMVLGYPTLSQAVWTLDLANDSFRVERPEQRLVS
ncbi:MAG: aspartyl protease family protein [Actinobacteria bacterium]|nr:aspartyl protease family protein [Actinomycetota bacterium]